MNENNLRICSRCVMDTSDPEIAFDQQGVCNHCHEFDSVTSKNWFPGPDGKEKFQIIVEKIKAQGRNKEYDCILGLSGGIDSSYLALLLKDFALRPLVVHVDAGWNSELAVYNIEQIVKYCGYELHTHVMNWNDMKELQLSYLKAGVANQDVPQDHAFFSSLYHFATANNINYVISGGNIATESVFPKAWHHSAMDAINLMDIHQKNSEYKLQDFKTISFFQYYFYYPFWKKMTTVRPLNFFPYDKKKALKELQEKVGYKDYGRKHGESRFTKFFQNYYLPSKFGMDKRKPHLASMILSGQITRQKALNELAKPLYDSAELSEDKLYIAKKLGLAEGELDAMISKQGESYTTYKNWNSRYEILKMIQQLIERVLGKNVKNYS